jgi:hypothetical protein
MMYPASLCLEPEACLGEEPMDETRLAIDRRTFIKGVGAAAGLVFVHGAWLPEAAAQRMMVTHGSALRGIDLPKKMGRFAQGRFGFMFPELPAYEVPTPLTDALAASMRDPAPGGTAGDNNALPSGFTFLGQFIDHDLTMDRETLGNQVADPDGSVNFRAPTLNLDSVYNLIQPDGVSVGATRDPANPAKIFLQPNGNVMPDSGPETPRSGDDLNVLDLPRNSDGTAQIADPRNEENLLICQKHIAFARFHNRLVDEGKSFEEARQLTTWHYQWVVMTDFLPRIVGQDRINAVLEIKKNEKPKVKTTFFRPNNRNKLFMPLEFAVAAFRFGHTQVRNNYNPNLQIRVAIQQPIAGAGNLNGFRPIPGTHVMDFRNFFHFPDSPNPAVPPLFNSTRRMDAILSPNLLNLPVASLPNAPLRTSLPARNMERGVQVGLPSGQAVARAIGVPVLDNAELAPGAAVLADPGFAGECPLWFYLLAESAITENGERLGAVGGTIVAETLTAIMDADKESFFHADGWTPMSSPFRMQEFLEFAEVL